MIEPGQFPLGMHVPNMYRGKDQSGVLMPRFIPQMAAWLISLGYEVDGFSGEVTAFNLDELATYDVVCISVLSNTALHGLVLAKQLQDRGVTVVMGGYYFAHNVQRDETLRQATNALRYCSYVVRGEGYVALPLLLQAIADGCGFDSVGGLSWRDAAGTTIHNPMGKGLSPEEYQELPPADWSCIQNSEKLFTLGAQGVQGCPGHCDWCAVWRRDGNGINQTPAVRMVNEIEVAWKRGGFKHLFITSDNFPTFHKLARAVCEELIRRGLHRQIQWSCQGDAVSIVKRPWLVKLMAEAGCVRTCIGIESLNQATLEAISKGKQSRKLIAQAIRICHNHGIAVHGMFIVGLPGDTPETAEEARRWAQRHGVETVQFLCLSAFPGSKDYEDYELWDKTFRPFTGDLELVNDLFVNGHYAQLTNEVMTLVDIQRCSIDAMDRFYRWWRVLAPLFTPNVRAYWAGLRQSRGLFGSLGYSVSHQVITALLRWRGRTSIDAWRLHPINQCWLELIATTPGTEQFETLKTKLLSLLPAGWVETLEAAS
ncbi:MAG: radical SAM protein [Thermoleophilia bacterium]